MVSKGAPSSCEESLHTCVVLISGSSGIPIQSRWSWERKESFFISKTFPACESVVWPLQVANGQSFWMVSENKLLQSRMKSAHIHMFNVCSHLRDAAPSGAFVGYALIKHYSGPHDWQIISRSCWNVVLMQFDFAMLLHKFQGPGHVAVLRGRCGGSEIKEGRK